MILHLAECCLGIDRTGAGALIMDDLAPGTTVRLDPVVADLWAVTSDDDDDGDDDESDASSPRLVLTAVPSVRMLHSPGASHRAVLFMFLAVTPPPPLLPFEPDDLIEGSFELAVLPLSITPDLYLPTFSTEILR